MKNFILVKDMTKLFTKEMLLYSLFDVSFKKPIRVVFLVYLILLLVVYALPLAYFFYPLNPYTSILTLGPPFALATLMSKPIWGGKSFFSWFKCQIRFICSKKHYYDGYAKNNLRRTYKVDHVYTVSRRKDFNILFNIVQQERENLKKKVRRKAS